MSAVQSPNRCDSPCSASTASNDWTAAPVSDNPRAIRDRAANPSGASAGTASTKRVSAWTASAWSPVCSRDVPSRYQKRGGIPTVSPPPPVSAATAPSQFFHPASASASTIRSSTAAEPTGARWVRRALLAFQYLPSAISRRIESGIDEAPSETGLDWAVTGSARNKDTPGTTGNS